jgi:hypothetical protein
MPLWNPNNIMDVPPYPKNRFDSVPENTAALRRGDDPKDYAAGR